MPFASPGTPVEACLSKHTQWSAGAGQSPHSQGGPEGKLTEGKLTLDNSVFVCFFYGSLDYIWY